MSLRLPRTVRLDGSDLQVFESAAEPGEIAVSGAFAFLDREPASLQGKERQAFAGGFLGTESFGWASLVVVSDATEAEREELVGRLSRHFVDRWGAPSLAEAEPVAREEVAFAEGLCQEHPVNTLLSVVREWGEDGIREGFRVVRPPRQGDHARVWEIDAEEGVDLVAMARGGS